ncbi:MAG: hypothetical protein ACOY5F_11905 [Pseudomonadota bacterium]|jgi:hypothetical protein
MIGKTVSCLVSDAALITAAFFVRNAIVLAALSAVALTVFVQ